jgi:hypothetical protein
LKAELFPEDGANGEEPKLFGVFDPVNCGAFGRQGGLVPVFGCDPQQDLEESLSDDSSVANGLCRICGNDSEEGYEGCAFGLYEKYYDIPESLKAKSLPELKDQANQYPEELEVTMVLGIPVPVNCDKYYRRLNELRQFAFNVRADGEELTGNCAFNKETFDIPPFIENFPGIGNPIAECPPHFVADYIATWINANYQFKTTKNRNGDVFPKPEFIEKFPSLAVQAKPSLIDLNNFQKKCDALALGQEVNIFDAGEVATFAITSKTLGERILRPAVYAIDGASNCAQISKGSLPEFEQCTFIDANQIQNARTWVNGSESEGFALTAEGRTTGEYTYHDPSASRPQTTNTNGQRTRRIGKQMHGKGHGCIYAEMNFKPLKEIYLANYKEGDDLFIPKSRRVGLLDERLVLNETEVTFDTLTRHSGNKNITDVKDVHDIRIRGFGIKLFGVKSAFGQLGMPYKQLRLPFLPASDQPPSGRLTFNDFNFNPEQEEGNMDFLHVAIGNGLQLGGPDALLEPTGRCISCTPENNPAGCCKADNATIGIFDPRTKDGTVFPPDNVFVASNVENYFNGFILGSAPANLAGITEVFQNPMEYTYGSASPLRAGGGASMKMFWAHCPGEQEKLQDVYPDIFTAFRDPNFHSTNLKYTIQGLDREGYSDFKFCGYLQFQEDPCLQPLSEPVTRWDTPVIPFAQLIFPAQTVDDYNIFCDNTVYNPWRTVIEHQPQGFINRVRYAVYAYAAQYRLLVNNGVIPKQPFIDTADDSGYTIGQNVCPYGYSGDDQRSRFRPIEIGTRGPYLGQPVTALTVDIGKSLGELVNGELEGGGIIQPPSGPNNSVGYCLFDDECQLPFGPDVTCFDPGWLTGTCRPKEDGLF